MAERFTLPPPGFLRTEIIDLGPVIDPKFTDAHDWSEFLPPMHATPVHSPERDLRAADEAAALAPEVALSHAGVNDLLDGKRYEIISVGTRFVDRDTEYPVVVIYDYTDDIVVEAIVDVAQRSLVELRTTLNQPAVTAAEEARAIELVRRDGRLTEHGIDVGTGAGLIVEDVNFHSSRYGHRLVDLRFGPADRRLPTAFAIVDLSAQDVAELGLIPGGLS
ncbi:hypothetical protein DFR70_118135 [Nocardia tenerifensis]|uniref:Uncharacterized protein n=1 Tax=Nocardia tenerifensis TaxID=228006 RepID=A0A318JPU5_9NOCA|nr:hypothetical protein [Nocardia tenerifensis]PXX57480.1 hypothetical protein DFR70_118135 [Nocardia tenerifensis]